MDSQRAVGYCRGQVVVPVRGEVNRVADTPEGLSRARGSGSQATFARASHTMWGQLWQKIGRYQLPKSAGFS